MSLLIDWKTKTITVPQSYLTPLGGVYYKLDVDDFRLDLKDIEDSEEGMPHLDTHRHNTEVTIGGITLARVFEIINGYTITFENGSYAVTLTGANNNILDVLNFNSVSVTSTNSAGLITVVSGSGVTQQDKEDISDAVWDELTTEHALSGSSGEQLLKIYEDVYPPTQKEIVDTVSLVDGVLIDKPTMNVLDAITVSDNT